MSHHRASETPELGIKHFDKDQIDFLQRLFICSVKDRFSSIAARLGSLTFITFVSKLCKLPLQIISGTLFITFPAIYLFVWPILIFHLRRNMTVSDFYRGPAEGWHRSKMQTVRFFQRYIVRDITLTWDISLARYFWECSLAHWNLIRHFEKHEAWRTVKRKIVAFWGTTSSPTFTMH